MTLRPSEAQAATPPPSPDVSRTVTLVTGDRVTVLPGNRVSIQRGPGRSTIPMTTSTIDGHTTVVPADALPLLRADRIDRRLFDVTELLRSGYDDRKADLPLIVTDSAANDTAAKAASSRTVRSLPSIRASAVRTPKTGAGRFWQNLVVAKPAGAAKIWLDAVGHVTGAEGIQQIGAPTAWRAGRTGAGVTVAVLDTGIDTAHPDLAGRVDDQVDFSPIATGGAPTRDDVHDNDGHGTLVASVVGGSGAASNGKYRGVAPGARLISGKVGDSGFDISESSVLAAMEWASTEKHARVVSMSLGFTDAPGVDPLDAAVNRLTAANGTLFVVASGNEGRNGLASPGEADAALTVGAVDHDDRLWDKSSVGPRVGDGAVKPDVTAPGVAVTGAKSTTTYPEDGTLYTEADGTSLATPHVSGAAAILAGQHPDWSQAMLKSVLMGSASPGTDTDVFEQGAGRIDIPAAMRDTVLADPPGVSLGTQAWPHTDDTPITRDITYRNVGDRAVQLDLRLDVRAPDGNPAPGGYLTLGGKTLTVPAGGSARTTLTVHPSASAPDGNYSATIAATAGDQRVISPVGLVREPEHHTLTVEHFDRAGQPSDQFYTQVIGIDTPFAVNSADYLPADAGNTYPLRVPAGRYAVVTAMYDEHFNGIAMSRPVVDVQADTTVRLDGRDARPVSISVPDPAAEAASTAVTVGVHHQSEWAAVDMAVGDQELYTGQAGPDGSAGDYVSVIRKAYPGYQLAWHQPGALPTGFTRQVSAGDLATVDLTYRPQSSGTSTYLATTNAFTGYPLPMATIDAPLAPAVRFNAVQGATWRTTVRESQDDSPYASVSLDGPETVYEAGRTYQDTYGDPVIGPCLPASTRGAHWTTSALTVDVPMFCDGAGHPGQVDYGVTATTTLTRDGETVADGERAGRATVIAPPRAGDYQLTTDASRPSFASSTQVRTRWSFTIAPAAAGKPVTLPLSVVRFHPGPDAAAGKSFTIPVDVPQQPGTTRQPVTSLRVEASYDDGATWQQAVVTRTPTGAFRAALTHPATPGYVALRATASTAATTVTQTVLRAYRTA